MYFFTLWQNLHYDMLKNVMPCLKKKKVLFSNGWIKPEELVQILLLLLYDTSVVQDVRFV